MSIREEIFKTKLKKSKELIREALDKLYPKIGILWNTGKDSTTNLFLTKHFKRDIPVLFVDTTVHFQETYWFRDKLAKEWGLNLINVLPDSTYEEVKGDKAHCCHRLKITPMSKKIRQLELEAVIVGKRWSAYAANAKEDYLFKKETFNPVYPLLYWTDEDVWRFMKVYDIPQNPLYVKGYQSVKCMPCSEPVPKILERDEGAKNEEEIKEKLRALGYW